jgi:hypothetical protein
MQPTPNDPKPKSSYDLEDWPSLEELLKTFTMDEIEYGIYVSSEGGEEFSLVDTEPAPDAPPPSGPPHGDSST